MPQPSDFELLQNFVHQRNEGAFRLLVKRHASMMRSVAIRITGNDALSDEAVQAALIVLATKARQLRGENLGPWLHRTTTLCARNLVRGEMRETRKRSAFGMSIKSQSQPPNSPWNDVREILDEALLMLPQRDQEAIVLRYLKGLSLAEAGLALGTNAEAMRARVGRALEKLSTALKRRGVVLPLALLLAGLGQESAEAYIISKSWITRQITRALDAAPKPNPSWWFRIAPATVMAGSFGMAFFAIPQSKGLPEVRSSTQPKVAGISSGPNLVSKSGSRQVPNAESVKLLRAQIATMLPEHNSAALLADIIMRMTALNSTQMDTLVKELPVLANGSDTRFISGQIFEYWGSIDPQAADVALHSLVGNESYWTEIQSLFRAWMRRDREQAIARGLAPESDGKRFQTALSKLAEIDFPAATQLIIRCINERRKDCYVGVQAVITQGVVNDDMRVFEFLREIHNLQDSKLYWLALNTAAGEFDHGGTVGSLLYDHPEQTLIAISLVTDEANRRQAQEEILKFRDRKSAIKLPSR